MLKWLGVCVAGQNERCWDMDVPVEDRGSCGIPWLRRWRGWGGTLWFLSSLQPLLNHESGPPGPQTDVLGLVVACHPAQQQPLPKQEETQGYVRWREHQTKAWRRVSKKAGFLVWLVALLHFDGAASAIKTFWYLVPIFMGGFLNVCCFTMSSQIWLRN